MQRGDVPGGASGTIVMTGATGFLGSHVLARLLASQTDTHVVALVRQEPDVAARRLHTALRATGLAVPPDLGERLTPVRADIGHPRLGLDPHTYRELAERASAVWHTAADIRLLGDAEQLERTNVEGTRHVLDFAAAAAQRPRVLHTSTAYVAGKRRHGRVREGELDGSGGFLTGYEASKFRAEQLVREWSAAHGRPVTVFRPGVLTDHRPAPHGAPYSPHTVLAARLAILGRQRSGPLAARLGLSPEGVTEVDMPGDPEAHMNVLPVQYAADTMVLIARHPAPDGVTSYHVVHPQQTSVGSLLDALTHHAPWLRVRLTGKGSTPQGSAPGGDLSDLLLRESAGVALYADLHRTYDRTRSTALGTPEPPELDTAYLRASFTPPAPRGRAG